MNKMKKTKFPFRRIIGILLILLFITGVGVMASNAKLNNVKIILSNGYIMNVTTSKTKIADILDENRIILLPEESVNPSKESDLADNKTIRILKDEKQVLETAKEKENSENVTVDKLLKNYDTIVEKIEVVQEVIPFETITKDVSNNESNKRETIVQNGKDGLREVTYKVKYQNNQEIERVEIDSKVLEEPVNKIIEVRKRVTNRSRRSSTVTYNNGVWNYSPEELDLICAITAQECGSSYEGALAVITCACNRAESKGTDPLTEYMAPNQFCYSIDNYWKRRLNGNYSSNVSRAVKDALNGKRNHGYYSFRAAGHASGEYIGGNVYF